MSTVSVVPTAEASNTPPRVKLDVTDTGSPNIFSTTVTRLNPDGSTSVVRTPDGNPLTLVTSGTDRVGTVYDYEMPLGAPVSYSTRESPGTVSAEVTVDSSVVWLINVSVPALSKVIDLRADSFAEEEYAVQRGVFYPMGREHPVVQTDGQRKGAESSMTVATDTLVDLAAIKALVNSADVLLLNVPYTLGWGVDPAYISVGAVRNRRISDIGSDPQRAVVLPYIVVDAPVGGTTATRTYADLLTFATYAELNAAYPTYAALLAGP